MTSSSPENAGFLRLSVGAEQPEARLTVMNHAWRVVASGIGQVETELPPGIYKIEAQVSRNNWSDYVSLRNGPEHVVVPHFGIKSAVPYFGFTRSHEYHEALLNGPNDQADITAGKGARILMMARNWSPGGDAGEDLPRLRLERWRGDELADLHRSGRIEPGGDAAGAVTVDVNPGAYVISAETAFGRISQSVYALRGWETQVFVLQDFTTQRSEVETSGARPTVDVTQAIVRPGGGEPRLYELHEVGQTALAEGRVAFGRNIFDQIALQKFDGPLLGLLAAHILLLAEEQAETRPGKEPLVEFDRDQFELILRNTAKLIGKTQPDILALRTRSLEMPAPTDIEVTTPPLFVRSWNMLLEASKAGHPNLLPGSLWRRVRGNINSAPHFAWARADSLFAAQQRASEHWLAEKLTEAAQALNQPQPAFPLRTIAGHVTRGAENLLEDVLGNQDIDVARLAARVFEQGSSEKPDLSNLAAYAPKLDLRQFVENTDGEDDALKKVARYAKLPYSVAEDLLDNNAIRKMFSRSDK